MDTTELIRAWDNVCEHVKGYENVSASQINAFFPRLQPQAMSEDFLMLTADTEFIKTWVERHYTDVIKRALGEIYNEDFTVAIEVDPSAPTARATQGAGGGEPYAQNGSQPANRAPIRENDRGIAREAPEGKERNGGARGSEARANEYPSSTRREASSKYEESMRDDEHGTQSSTQREGGGAQGSSARGDLRCELGEFEARSAAQPPADATPTSGLTFENFVIGDSNRMAYSMAVAVAETPGKSHLNPLFIYGKSGLGKTHLMRAIQNYVHETAPRLSVVYVDSAELLSDYMEASAAHDKEKSSYKNFKTRYEEADVLLIDDVQYLQGKKQTLDIVFQIFNKMTTQGKQVVLSADRAPKNIDIDERYKSRFNSGGTFDIQPPEIETKLGIVKSFIEEYRENEGDSDFRIPEDIQMYIAEKSSSNIRELKSAVIKVIYQMTLLHQPDLDLDDVRSLLENHFSGGGAKRLSVGDIQKEVEAFFKVSHADLVGKKRTRNIIYARQVAIYLCRQMLDLPFNDIGKKFNRDHSTVMYSVTNIEEKMKTSRELREELETLRQIIREL